jgi:hypothetical protein
LFCNRCGHRNPEGANFCSSCGARIERSQSGAEPNTTSLPAVVVVGDSQGEPFQLDPGDLVHGVPGGGAVLVVIRGPNSGSRFVLTPDDAPVVTIGRHPDSDIFLDDITVSRRHAEVCYRDGGFWAHDVGSLNGTYVNRQMMSQDQLLASGDEVQVGKFRLLFLAPGAATTRAPGAPD